MERKKLVLITSLIALLLLMIGGTTYLLSNTLYFSNILYITSPVTSFSGTVDDIGDNFIIVSREMSLQSPNSPEIVVRGLAPSPHPTPVARTVRYKVFITQNTKIERPFLSVKYYFKKITPAPTPVLTAADVKVGESVEVLTNQDLRVLKKSEFEAIAINLPMVANDLEGEIVRKEGSVLVVEGYSLKIPNTPPLESKQYRVLVTEETEISTPLPLVNLQEPEPARQFKREDLNVGANIIVYTDGDIRGKTEIKALRIQPRDLK